MNSVRAKACSACPYRCDVPSGVWHHDEYDKLRVFDNPTSEQPVAPFMCHATPDFLCHGWAVVHTTRGHEFDLLVLRILPPADGIPEPSTELFGSGTEAADHGQRDFSAPGEQARQTMEKLIKQHARLARRS